MVLTFNITNRHCLDDACQGHRSHQYWNSTACSQLTMRCYNIILIHGLLDTKFFSPISPQRYKYSLTCPRALTGPLPPVVERTIGSSSPFLHSMSFNNGVIRDFMMCPRWITNLAGTDRSCARLRVVLQFSLHHFNLKGSKLDKGWSELYIFYGLTQVTRYEKCDFGREISLSLDFN